MSVFFGFLAGLIVGAIAATLLALPVFDFLDSVAALIAIIAFAATWYIVWKHLEARGRMV